MRPQILWITDEVPDPGRGGGSIRQYHLLRRVAAHADVDLVLAGGLQDEELRNVLRRVHCIVRPEPLGAAWTARGRLATVRRRLHNLASFAPGRLPSEVALNRPAVDALRRALPDTSSYDLVQVEHEHLGGLRPARPGSAWAITLHNLLSVRLRQRAAVSAKPRVRRLWEADARRAGRWEERIVNGYELTIVVSDEDAKCLHRPVAVVPNGVDLDRFLPDGIPAEPRMIFSGSFNYEPNVDGAVWLCEHILPLVRRQIPTATAMLVGRQPDPRVRRLATLPGVEAHFDVPEILPFLRSARIAVVTLRQGSGTRLKALEAMAAGRPLVGTPTGLEGLGLEDGHSAAVAAHAEDLATAAIRLLLDDGAAGAIAGAARRLAEERFGWDRLADEYLKHVSAALHAGARL